MRVAWFLLLAALATGCGSAEPGAERPGRYGISLDGEGGEVSRGLIRIARGDLSVVLYEHEPAPTEDSFFNDPWPVRLNAIDFRPRDGSPEAVRATSTAGRSFSVGVEAASPAAGRRSSS